MMVSKSIQDQWDEEHNIVSLMRKSHDDLYQFFEARFLGSKGIDLLKQSLIQVFRKQRKLFQNFHCDRTVTRLKDEPWIWDFWIIFALMDLELLEEINLDRVSCIRNAANSPDHFDTMFRRLMKENQKKNWETDWLNFRSSVVNAAKEAGIHATTEDGSIPGAQARKFISTFCEQLLNSRITEVSTITYLDEYAECNTDEFYTVSQALERELQTCPFQFSRSDVSAAIDVMKIFISQGSAQPRCMSPCRMCGMPCTLTIGHEEKHTTFHQPAGLGGTRYLSRNDLVSDSCSYSFHVTKGKFTIDDGKTFHEYKDWQKVFLDWSNPDSPDLNNRALQVRELIFAKLQRELVEQYPGTKVCAEIPHSFFRGADILKTVARNESRGVSMPDPL